MDFSGGSGRFDTGLANTAATKMSFTSGSLDLSAFIGSGTLSVPITTSGTASAEGPGNMYMELLTKAGATTSISYGYRPISRESEGADVACFVIGTRILTPDGMVSVESLRVGEAVATRFRGQAPIVWIGTRAVDCDGHPNRRASGQC